MRVLFFGRLRDVAGAAEIAVDAPAGSLSELRARLAVDNPLLGEALQAKGVRVAIDQAMVGSDAPIPPAACEVAFMAPMSGG